MERSQLKAAVEMSLRGFLPEELVQIFIRHADWRALEYHAEGVVSRYDCEDEDDLYSRLKPRDLLNVGLTWDEMVEPVECWPDENGNKFWRQLANLVRDCYNYSDAKTVTERNGYYDKFHNVADMTLDVLLKTERTPREWLEQFVPSVQESIRRQIEDDDMLDEDDTISFCSFIDKIFTWSCSSEGEKYWMDIHNNPRQHPEIFIITNKADTATVELQTDVAPLTLADVASKFTQKWKIGLELTYYPKFVFPYEFLSKKERDEMRSKISGVKPHDVLQRMRNYYADTLRDNVALDTNFVKSSGIDNSAWEIQTEPCDDIEEILSNIEKLEDDLAQFGMIPSSVVDMQTEGGCHINFDIVELKREVEKLCSETGITEALYTSLAAYINNYPAIAWAFLAPNDNQSSNIVPLPTEKGHFATMRKGSRIELRFFMMPRNIQEHWLHLTFAQSLMSYVLTNIVNNKAFVFVGRTKKLSEMTLDEAIEQIKTVCRQIGFPYKELVKCGKIELLKERFELGAEWLV